MNRVGANDPSSDRSTVGSCPACGRARRDGDAVCPLETPRGRNPWARCPGCAAYFLDDSYVLGVEVAHTETKPWGQLQAGLDLNHFKRRMFVAVLALLEQHQPAPARILDVGCSFGGFAIEASQAGYDVYGMDITPAAVDYVRSIGLGAECCSTPDDLRGIPAHSLDVVTCLDCQPLWPDQPAQLAAIHGKLRPGGLLVMRVVDKSWMFTLGRRLHRFFPGLAERVMREAVNDNRLSMPVHSLRRQLEHQGFDIVTISIWAAVHSDQTRWPAKLSFALGAMAWPVLRRNYAPGAVLMAKKGSGH